MDTHPKVGLPKLHYKSARFFGDERFWPEARLEGTIFSVKGTGEFYDEK